MFQNLCNVCFEKTNVFFSKRHIFCDSKDIFQTSFKIHISTYSKDTFQKDTFKTHISKHFKTHISCDQLLLEKYKSWNVSFDVIIWVFKRQIRLLPKHTFAFQKEYLLLEFSSGIPDRDYEMCLLSKIICVLKNHIC